MEITNKQIEFERAAIVGVIGQRDTEDEVNTSLDELERLLETAGGQAAVRLLQSKESPDPKTYIGSGKLKELKELCENEELKLAVFDDELSPSQIKNIEDALEDVRVIDRSMLILDIFALHAVTAEGKLQVELAQLRYTVPRLIGKGAQLSRQQGGNIAMRGPGESKLESDKRHIKRRIHALEEELAELESRRQTSRKLRDRSGMLKIAVAGYTNAGKSTLLNRLTGSDILAEDKLFATLDPSTRKFTLPDGTPLLMTDTVGFIRNLPHHLIKAFSSTLDEVVYADIILVMADASDPECVTQLSVTEKLLSELGASDKPVVYALNKCDVCEYPPFLTGVNTENIFHISAVTGEGLDALVARLGQLAAENNRRAVYRFPHSDRSELSRFYGMANVISTEEADDCTYVTADCGERARGAFEKWRC